MLRGWSGDGEMQCGDEVGARRNVWVRGEDGAKSCSRVTLYYEHVYSSVVRQNQDPKFLQIIFELKISRSK